MGYYITGVGGNKHPQLVMNVEIGGKVVLALIDSGYNRYSVGRAWYKRHGERMLCLVPWSAFMVRQINMPVSQCD